MQHEPASSLPHSLVQQFEAGEGTECTIETVSSYGHMSNTLNVVKKSVDEQQAKKIKLERPCCTNLEGYVHTCTCISMYN